MKKIALVAVLSVLAPSSYAGTQASLVLKGIVQPVLEIEIDATEAAEDLNLGDQASNLKVATLTERSNYPTGYKIKAKSTNGMKLVNASDVNTNVPYTMSYDGSNITLTPSPTQIYHTANLKGTYTKDVKISFNRPSNLSAGTYTDTVQFTIEAN